MNKNLLVFWLSASFVFAFDRVTKVWAERTLTLGEKVPGIDGWYEWSLFYNPGAAGGIFSGHLEFLITVSALAVIALVGFMVKGRHDRNLWLQIGLGLMLGGALGNLFDRVFYQHVIDFINPIGESHIFNIADKGIHWGLYLCLLGLWLSRRKLNKAAQASAPEQQRLEQ
ncbi:signal peptidase II [Tumebacillus algifaecis]|uniref:Lipoprotein signal peptidase n=1 Tax=Tumebacillus algifaecis TaxID=1214604 RepID=A0A223D2J3_9BACL|nr:signal peptidase II [Tumebacillus algifaecis]ASS75899.1 signal peptidase II [Tumebacillus algifaecis]